MIECMAWKEIEPCQTPPFPLLPQSNGEKGIAVCEVVCKGRAGHGSIPKGGDNALVKAAEAVQAIQAYWPPTVRACAYGRTRSYLHRKPSDCD